MAVSDSGPCVTFVALDAMGRPLFLFDASSLYSAMQRVAIHADDEHWRDVEFVRHAGGADYPKELRFI